MFRTMKGDICLFIITIIDQKNQIQTTKIILFQPKKKYDVKSSNSNMHIFGIPGNSLTDIIFKGKITMFIPEFSKQIYQPNS